MIPLLWLLLTCSACDSRHSLNQDQQISSIRAIPPDTVITLERTSCRGACPFYKIRISADGSVFFRGKLFVNSKRPKSNLTQEQLSQLLAEFEKIDYFSLRDRYQYLSDGCSGSGLDHPGAITSLRINGRTKTITHDYGCTERSADGRPGAVYPKALFALEERIDETVGIRK
jgi:hypothetical protein